MTQGWPARFIILALTFALSSCSGVQSALDTHGVEAGKIASLIWIFTVLCTVIWIAVLLVLGIGLSKRENAATPLALHYGQGRTVAVAVATGLTGIVIIGLTVLSYLTDKGLATPLINPVSITLTGHQWWWEIRYDNPDPSKTFTVANEIHVPVGRPIHVSLQSDDVIHSFWVPSLAGKIDLIPGWKNTLTFTAEEEGFYRGQCAEFCGMQHAHMGLLVIAEKPEKFDAWAEHMIASAIMPAKRENTGEQVFMSKGCILCHTIRGTPAGGGLGPELTHFGSQRSIAADTLPLTHANLVTWIRDPQGTKPGANMPRVEMTESERESLVSYLEGLK
jgi:cytochrome c oxidase subunit 2